MGHIARSLQQADSPMTGPGVEPLCGFEKLPYELVAMIAQYLHGSDLAAFATLRPNNTYYTQVVQQVLFGHVTVESYERYARLIRTLQHGTTPTRCIILASMVRSINAILDTRPSRGEQRFIARDLLNLYVQCPELNHITLLGARDHLPPNPDDYGLIDALECIKSLTLTCPLGSLGPSLLLGLPSLDELHILGGPAVFRLTQTPRSGSLIRRITWASETAPTLQVIRWICAHSTEATRGHIKLITPPISGSELDSIREYALSRNMIFYSSPLQHRGSAA